MRRMRLWLLAAVLCACSGLPAGTSPGATSSTPKTSSPFSLFTKGLPQEKRKPFMELMKKLRTTKQSTGSKEDKKKATMSIDGEIHKLLGEDYKKYRQITEKIKSLHATKKEEAGSSTPPPPPPPPPLAKSGKKKKKGTL
ncbi:hypothetical protein AB1Y20_020005 [Prymnesium parvum]|uniref:Uncharacterized protein n=1 Tax=Prymnesium parvum TaxID=97485 RepID=A0AB34JVS6_PRYPA